MMADKESVQPAMDKSDQPTHSVDYYYLEAMRLLTCKAVHHSEDSGDEDDNESHECDCKRCRAEKRDEGSGGGGTNGSINSVDDENDDNDEETLGLRERSWSHSMAKDRETGTLAELPNIDGKFVGSRLKNRRFSDGMLLKRNMKVTDGHVHWADECKKELTRFRPRKTYTRSPAVHAAPKRSILKNCSEESLVIPESQHSDSDTDD